MRNSSAIFILLCICSWSAAEEPTFQFETAPQWRSERFQLPPKFAPKMKISGVEELRFAPGMFKKDAADFLSYAFVFAVDKPTDLTKEMLVSELTAYYRGLSQAVMRKPVDAERDITKVELKDIQKRGKFSEQWKEVISLQGSVTWVEPFVTKQPQKLLLTVDKFSIENSDRKYVFICASPATRDAEIWKTLHKIRESLVISEK